MQSLKLSGKIAKEGSNMETFEEAYEKVMLEGGEAEKAAEDGLTELVWQHVRSAWQLAARYAKELPEGAEERARAIFEKANQASKEEGSVYLINVDGALARLRGMLPVALR